MIGHHISDPGGTRGAASGPGGLIDPATLFCQLSAALRTDDLVAVGDALVLTPRFGDPADERPWFPLGELGERVDRFRGRAPAPHRPLAWSGPGPSHARNPWFGSPSWPVACPSRN